MHAHIHRGANQQIPQLCLSCASSPTWTTLVQYTSPQPFPLSGPSLKGCSVLFATHKYLLPYLAFCNWLFMCGERLASRQGHHIIAMYVTIQLSTRPHFRLIVHPHMYAHTCMQTYVHTHTHRHSHTQTHTHKHAKTHTNTLLHGYTHTHTHARTHTHTYTVCSLT